MSNLMYVLAVGEPMPRRVVRKGTREECEREQQRCGGEIYLARDWALKHNMFPKDVMDWEEREDV